MPGDYSPAPAGQANRSVHEHIFKHGETHPTKPAVTWIGENGKEQGVRTYGDLCQRARAVAYRLVEKYGVKPGDRVVLVLPPGLEFLDAFFGCMVAGAVAVPVYPPNPATIMKDLERLNRIVKTANVKVRWGHACRPGHAV
jgi:acyl-CoA synthetase (AMP-forming)/AMP-acid ligase II